MKLVNYSSTLVRFWHKRHSIGTFQANISLGQGSEPEAYKNVRPNALSRNSTLSQNFFIAFLKNLSKSYKIFDTILGVIYAFYSGNKDVMHCATLCKKVKFRNLVERNFPYASPTQTSWSMQI